MISHKATEVAVTEDLLPKQGYAFISNPAELPEKKTFTAGYHGIVDKETTTESKRNPTE